MKYKRSMLGVLLLLNIPSLLAQIPYHSPSPSKNFPLDLNNPREIVLYIVIPGIAVILTIIAWRARKKKNM